MNFKLSLILFVAFTFLSSAAFSQSPDLINYQAVARDLSGNPLVSTAVNITFDIRQTTPTGTIVYSETHNLTTNQFGLFTAEIGGGTPVTGTFSGINWSTGLYYLQVTVNGDVMAATQLLSVPFALHANTATSGTPGANGHANIADSVAEPAGVNCANGGYLIHMGVDDNDNSTLDSLEIDISYYICNGLDGAANNNDTSATNELQTLSISNDTVFLSSGGFIVLPPALGDDWGSQVVVSTGSNISGDGTAGNPLNVFDNDTSATNEIELPATATTNDVLTWNGTNWVAQVPSSGADNWGSQVVVSTGSNISGDGTAGNPLSVFDNDTSSTNELQNLSISGNNLNISSGTGTQISPIPPVTGDLLYWNGANWVAQAVAGNTDNQNLLNGGKAGNNQTINIQNGTGVTFSVADGDSSDFNEYNTSFQVNGPNLELTDGGNTFQVPLSNLSDNDWNVNGTHLENTNTGNVGIGPMHSTIGGPGYFLTSGKALTIATTNGYFTNPPATVELVSSSANSNDIMGRLAFGHVLNAPTFPIYIGGIEMSKLGDMMFSTNGANERVRFTSNGDVGIGITTPNTKLHVAGGHITMEDGNEQVGYIPVSNANGMMTWTDPTTITTADDGDWITNVGTVYNTTHNVGIGTASPGAQLEVRTTSTERAAQFISNFSSASNKYGLYALAQGGSTGENIGAQGEATGATTNKGIVGRAFGGTNNWAGYFEVGNVYIADYLAIGITTPNFPLHVRTTSNVRGAYIETNGANSGGSKIGVTGISTNGAGTGINKGGAFNAIGGSGGDNYGVDAQAVNGASNQRGLNAIASGGSGTNYGVYSSALGGTTNWSGYFASGNVYVADFVGIGTTTPLSNLTVLQTATSADGTNGVRVEFGTASWNMYHSGAHLSFANVGVRQAYITGGTGVYVVTSDMNKKKNISLLGNVLPNLMQLKPSRYQYKYSGDDSPYTYGIMVQDVQKVFPELVHVAENGDLGLGYDEFVPIAIKAIQEQQKMIEELKLEIEKLKKQ